jgi:hypothetical protein
VTTGSQNVIIGHQVIVPDGTDSCQLAIGFSNTENWLTGDSTKAIKPGAGIIDSTGACGTSGQVLTSTGTNAIQWASVPTWESLETTKLYATPGENHGIFEVADTATNLFGASVIVSARKSGSDVATIKQYLNIFGPGSIQATDTAIKEVDYPTDVGSNWDVGFYPDGRAYWAFLSTTAGTYEFKIVYQRLFGGPVSIVGP